MIAEAKQTLGFQTEVKQLLHLMIHSLYSNKEIFLRELISNASDACDKFRFLALNQNDLLADDSELKIRIEFDKDAKTIAVIDNGVGMSRPEIIEHLGTIAKSGTAQFLTALTGDQKKDANLIGQFGVGFYSAFVVAHKVEVYSRKAGLPEAEGVRWESEGQGEFTVESVALPQRGTRVVLHLSDAESEYADGWRLRSIIRKYSDHISFPIVMIKEHYGEEEKDKPAEDEVVNKATALWTRPRGEIKDEEYQEFYKYISHDFEDALSWSHNKVEGSQEYTSLLFVPKNASFDLYNRDNPKGLKLYVQRVFVMDDAEQFLPLYLRFIKGILDSNDLPLNVSREILQNNKTVEAVRGALTKRILDLLMRLASEDAEKYATFWKNFGQVLKEGAAEDFANREKIMKLLRFATTHTGTEEQTVSLDDYISRMKEGQSKIYYITAETFSAAANSPHLEFFRKKGVEVILMYDRIDEWVMGQVFEYDGKSFQHVAKGELDLDKLGSEEDKAEQEKTAKQTQGLVNRIKELLQDKVSEVRVTHRLVDSPACLVVNNQDMGAQMRQIMKAMGQAMPDTKPAFEVNPHHPLVTKLDHETDENRFKELVWVLFDQATLAEGGHLLDPAQYVHRVNKLLLELSK